MEVHRRTIIRYMVRIGDGSRCRRSRQDGTATLTQSRGILSLTCGVALNIRASAPRIWTLLTDAKDFPRWNSTVIRVEGQIGKGERLRLHLPGTDRTFTPRWLGCSQRAHDLVRGIFSRVQRRAHFRAATVQRWLDQVSDGRELLRAVGALR